MTHNGYSISGYSSDIYNKIITGGDIREAVSSGRYLEAMNIHRDKVSNITEAELLTLISLHKLRKELESA